jgi:hypothetical protein
MAEAAVHMQALLLEEDIALVAQHLLGTVRALSSAGAAKRRRAPCSFALEGGVYCHDDVISQTIVTCGCQGS